MDNLFIWMLISAGAVIGLLATFLLASERELKIKRRQLEIFADKLAGLTDTGSTNEAVQNTDGGQIQQLETTNAQPHEEVESLSRKLEASEERAQELTARVRELNNLLSENERLRTANEELSDKIAGLRDQLAGLRTAENLVPAQQQALEEQNSALEQELSKAKARLEETEVKLEEMRKLEVEIEEAKSREQEAKNRSAEDQTQIAELTDQLARSREKLAEFDSRVTRLQDVERRYEQASAESAHLREEISNWQERLAAACTSMRGLEILRQHFDGLHATQRELLEKQEDFQRGMSAFKDRLEEALPANFEAGVTVTSAVACIPKSLSLPPLGEEVSLEAAKRNIESGYFEEALQQLDQLLRDGHDNRMIRLYHLLASVQLHHGNGFEQQIDAITEMPDLSDTERLIARDIFLARAEEAQKCGRDHEMLRYRAWAKNVIYRTPFGSAELGPSRGIDGSGIKAGATGETGGSNDASDGTGDHDPQHGKAGVILATTIGLLVIAGIMFAGSLEQPKSTAIAPSTPAVQRPSTSAKSETSKPPLAPSLNSPAAKEKSSAIRMTPNNQASERRGTA